MPSAVAGRGRATGLPCQVAVEERMACGLGVCWTCVVPVIALDGRGWWNVRACLEGPVFNGARIWWDRWLGRPEPEVEPEAEEPADMEEAEEAQEFSPR